MRNKKAIELSINFIVIIIIALVIFSSGIYLVRKYYKFAIDEQNQLTEQQRHQIADLLKSGKKVIIPENGKTLSRGESYVFGLGILNTNPQYKNFRITAECSKAMINNQQVPDCIGTAFDSCPNCLLFNKEPFVVENNEDHEEPILLKVPEEAESGEYIFDVNVITEPNIPYGTPQKIILTVS